MTISCFYKWESLETMFNNYLFHKHLLKACLAAVFAIGLAACSSSSDNGGSASNGDQMTGPTVAELQAQIDALRTQLGIDDTADIGDSITALQAELKRLQDEAQARMDAEQAAKDKEMAAAARALALGLDAASHFDDTDAGTLSVTAKYGEMAMLAGDASTGFFATDTTTEPMFKAADSMSLGMMNGWSGTQLMSMVENGPTDMVHVYTNVGPDNTVPFAEWASVTDGVAFANGAVTVAAGNSALIMADVFATGSGTVTHELNTNDDTDPAADLFVTAGYFGGARGTYTCDGDGTHTCTSAVAGSNGGVILSGTGQTWTFTPNDRAMAKVPDSEYQNFGWWLRKTDAGYTVHAFTGSMGGTAISDIAPVGGTATYTGPAAGKYSIYDSGPKGGHFTAMVELKADFGTTDAGSEGTISGMIDSFMGDTAGMDTWMVKLPALDLATAGTFAAATAGTPTDAEKPVWSIGDAAGATAADSEWGGSLHSPNAGGTPQVAVGTFSANYGVIGNMRGAFGAARSGP